MNPLYLQELPENWDPREHFPDFNHWRLEVGCGKGRFLSEWASGRPDWGHVGLELRRDRARRTAKKIASAGISNAMALCGRMELLLDKLTPSIRFEAIHLNFPDPWPKNRHAKHRLIAPRFLEVYRGLLAPGGRLVFVTDDWAYSLEGEYNLTRAGFVDVFGGVRCHWPCYPVTIHEEKFRARGLEIWYRQFAKPLEPLK